MSQPLSDLYVALNEDRERRDSLGFSDDIMIANEVLHHRYARSPERAEALGNWLQEVHQPCLFGRLAAKRNEIHYCFLTVEDLLKPDDFIRQKIANSKRLWKQRAYRGEPVSGFILSVCDDKLGWASPDETLRRFALRLQELSGWIGREDIRENTVADEWVYLKHPKTDQVVKFTFSVDFFSSAADKRWWHDHRIPGGMAFTANSLGHMMRHQEWILNRRDRTEWALQLAMSTIDSAKKDVPSGPATYLLDEKAKGPIRPYQWTKASKPSDIQKLADKDCGSYGGYLHTDHAVRREFFQPHPLPLYKNDPYAMDFSYIFDPANGDFNKFIQGENADRSVVESELRLDEEIRIMSDEVGADPSVMHRRSPGDAMSIEQALKKCREWRMSDETEANLL